MISRNVTVAQYVELEIGVGDPDGVLRSTMVLEKVLFRVGTGRPDDGPGV
jgi:hypothetical protein